MSEWSWKKYLTVMALLMLATWGFLTVMCWWLPSSFWMLPCGGH